MPNIIDITVEYFRQYRKKLGFSNQGDVKDFFGAKDLVPVVDFEYLKLLNQRLYELVDRVNSVVAEDVKISTINAFKREFVDRTFEIMKKNDILPRLNNLGRRPEKVYFDWMRGFIVSNYFLKALGIIFEVELASIVLIGDDDLKNIETFKKTPKADREIELKNKEKIRIEIQAGFTGVNDIKQHKVLEARRVFKELGMHTLVIHFDLYNGQVAFVKIDQISDTDVNWEARQQMEGQLVFSIDQHHFFWKITEEPVKYKDMNL